jgi:hypothetical protein
MENTYWNHKGRFEEENKKLWEKYVPAQGVRLTTSRSANRALVAYVRNSKKYYRYYNDGDRASGIGMAPGNYSTYNRTPAQREHNEEVLERATDRVILRAWAATEHATLPIVDEISDAYDNEYELRIK